MLNRSKVRKYLSIRWDISFRKSYLNKSEDEQIDCLMEAHWHLAGLAEQGKRIIGHFKAKQQASKDFYTGNEW